MAHNLSEAQLLIITSCITVLGMVTFVTLERKIPYTKGLPFFREGFWLDFVWYSVIQSFLLQILIFDLIIQPVNHRFHLSDLRLITAWPLLWQVLFFLVVHDFYIYWFHRWQHNSKILWRTHEAHHSGTKVDWLAGSRSHSMEIIINQTVEFAPIILLGADPFVVPIKAAIDAVWGMYIHSNIDVRSGKLQYVINGPEMHQWHHADAREVFFANYSTKFAVWDWIFGTAYLPDLKPTKFGLHYDYPKDYFLQHLALVKKVDEEKLLQSSKLFKSYYTLRPRLVQKLFGKKRGKATEVLTQQAQETENV